MSSLPVGTAWVWSPGWLGLLQKVAVRRRLTYDSSATPKVSANNTASSINFTSNSESMEWKPVTVAPLPLAETIARLQARLVESIPDGFALEETGLPVRTVEVRVPVEVRVEVPVLREGEREELQRLAASLLEGADAWNAQARELHQAAQNIEGRLNALPITAALSPASAAPGVFPVAFSRRNGRVIIRANTAAPPHLVTGTSISTLTEDAAYAAEKTLDDKTSSEKVKYRRLKTTACP